MRTILTTILLFYGTLTALISLAQETALPTDATKGNASPPARLNVVMDAEVANVLARFPVDTEAITVARGPFDLINIAAVHTDSAGKPELLPDLQHLPTAILLILREGAYGKLLAGAKGVLAAEGARRFRAPTGLGMSRFEGCQVLVLADDKESVAKLDRVIELVRKDASRKRWMMRQEVFSMSEKAEDDVWDVHIVRPSPHEVLLATDEDYLKDVLARLEVLKKGGKRPVDALAGFAGWKHVDTAGPFWAVRRYDVSAAPEDPSSPIRLDAAAPVHDTSAIGITVAYVPGKPGRIQMHYLTASADAKAKAAELWRPLGLFSNGPAPMLHEVEPGVIRLETNIGALSNWMFGIMCLIGHVVFV